MGQSEILLETSGGTHFELDENKVKTWWEQQKIHKTLLPGRSLSTTPQLEKN